MMSCKLKMTLVNGASGILIVLISLLITPRNSQQVEEGITEVTTLDNNKLEALLEFAQPVNRTALFDVVCGPPIARLSEEDGCITESYTSIPCPTLSFLGDMIWKKCAPAYASRYRDGNVVQYQCRKQGWVPLNDPCAADCSESTKSNKYPWIVAIYNSEEELTCTGTIISPFYVLTVTACFVMDPFAQEPLLNSKNYTIVAGKHYSNIHRKHGSAQARKVKRAIVHDKQRGLLLPVGMREQYDLVLFEVDQEFSLFGDIRQACLDWGNFFEESDFRDGNDAVAVGWTHDREEVIPCEDPTEFNVQYWQREICYQNMIEQGMNAGRLLAKIKSHYFGMNKICGLYTGDQRNCGLSIGVGLFFKSSPWQYYLKGVTSSITRTGNLTYIFYTKVSLFTDWLKDNIRRHSDTPNPFERSFSLFEPIKEGGCTLPEHIKYGRFRLILGRAYIVNMWVPSSTKLILSCAGSGNQTLIFIRCSLGAWIPPIDKLKCKRPGSCPALLPSESEDVRCRLNGQEVSCIDAEDNTTAVIRCKPFHIVSGNKPIYKCHDGVWDQPFTRCTLECGTKRVGVTTLTIGGSETIRNEYPWVVAIYRFTELICGGTVISKKYVLSAAHCFTDAKGTPKSKDIYTIIAGKYYRNISEIEPSAQSRKIRSLHIHDDYKGKLQKYRDDIALIELDMELTPTWEVQPACLDWDSEYEDFDFVDGNNGVVTGWGYTEEAGSPSSVLRKLVLPFRPKDVCVKNLPKDFREQYVATDKICAGYEDNDMNVCTGDSGGGLYFKSGDNRFYVRGIVSLTVRNDVGGCRSNKFALYTKVSKYLSWIEAITRRIL